MDSPSQRSLSLNVQVSYEKVIVEACSRREIHAASIGTITQQSRNRFPAPCSHLASSTDFTWKEEIAVVERYWLRCNRTAQYY